MKWAMEISLRGGLWACVLCRGRGRSKWCLGRKMKEWWGVRRSGLGMWGVIRFWSVFIWLFCCRYLGSCGRGKYEMFSESNVTLVLKAKTLRSINGKMVKRVGSHQRPVTGGGGRVWSALPFI